jgi:L-iditol 2-dehydrogenase
LLFVAIFCVFSLIITIIMKSEVGSFIESQDVIQIRRSASAMSMNRSFNSDSSDENLCVVLHGVKDIKLERRPIPQPKSGEVQIAIRTVGICCSDVHYYHHGKIGDFIVEQPMIMGHEASGLVTGLGAGVTGLKVGDRVTIEPTVPCSRCQACKIGRYNLCPNVACCATPPYDGNMSQFYCQQADFVHKVPSNMTWMQAALCEPVACAVSACRRGNVGVGKSVLIFGAGPIGLLTAMVARASGCCNIGIVDVLQQRIEFARHALGRDVGVFLADMTASSSQTAKDAVEVAMAGMQPDVSIDCSGAESAVQAAIFATKSGGVVTLCGMGAPMIRVPIIEAMCREVEIRGVFRYANCFPTAISLIASGRVDAMKVVTHRVPLEDGIKAYELASNPAKSGAVKVMVDCERSYSGSYPSHVYLTSPAVVTGLNFKAKHSCDHSADESDEGRAESNHTDEISSESD